MEDPPDRTRAGFAGASAPGSFFLELRTNGGRLCDPGCLAEWLHAGNHESLAA